MLPGRPWGPHPQVRGTEGAGPGAVRAPPPPRSPTQPRSHGRVRAAARGQRGAAGAGVAQGPGSPGRPQDPPGSAEPTGPCLAARYPADDITVLVSMATASHGRLGSRSYVTRSRPDAGPARHPGTRHRAPSLGTPRAR